MWRKTTMIGVAVGCLLLLFSGIALALNYFLLQADENIGASVVEDVAIAKEGDSYRDDDGTLHITDEVKQGIDELHGIYNDMLGWGRDSQFEDPDHWNYGPLEMHQQMFVDLAGKASGDLRQDFINGAELLDVAMKEQSVTALLYTHRILHDLDIKMNDYDQNMFGYTRTVHDSDRVDEFIADHE